MKGNFLLFLYLNWQYILLSFILLSFLFVAGYKQYRKTATISDIKDINAEEANIRRLMRKNQEDYLKGKISEDSYEENLDQDEKEVEKLRRKRTKLRNIIIKILKPREVSKEIINEKKETEKEIKKIQKEYYVDKKLPEREYNLEYKGLNERLAEIEGEKTTLELLNKESFRKNHLKRKHKHKKGIVLMDGSILEFLKKEAKNKDFKGKYIKINIKKKGKR